MIIQGIRYASDFEAKKLMIEIGKSRDEKGYTLAQDGSMSVRVGPNAVWITIQDSENGALTQGDFIRVDLNGKSMNHSPDACLPEDLEIRYATAHVVPGLDDFFAQPKDLRKHPQFRLERLHIPP